MKKKRLECPVVSQISTLGPLRFHLQSDATRMSRWLPSNRRRLPSNRRRLPSNRRRLPCTFFEKILSIKK